MLRGTDSRICDTTISNFTTTTAHATTTTATIVVTNFWPTYPIFINFRAESLGYRSMNITTTLDGIARERGVDLANMALYACR